MKTSLDHLPAPKREKLSALVDLFREALPRGLLVLFGSYARGDWVDDSESGYKSDLDLLAVVRDPKQASEEGFFRALEGRFREAVAPTPVTLLAHELKFVNREIRMGQYFFADVVNEGVLLYAGEKLDFAKPKALDASGRLQLGEHNYGYWFHSASLFFRGGRYYAGLGELNPAAFLLHQAAERYYHAATLVLAGYKHRTHDLNVLGQKAAEQHPLLVEALPKTEPEDERLYTLLRKAYIEARYSKSYRITLDELTALQGRVIELARRVRTACLEKLATFVGPEAVRADLPSPPALDEPLLTHLPPVPDEPADVPRWAASVADLAEVRAREGELRGRAEGWREGKEEGLREGKAEGLREGKAEGLREGKAEGLREGEAKGLREGEAKGKAEGLRAAVFDLCELLDLVLTAPQRAQLEAMAASELEALRRELKQTKRWPEGVGGSKGGT